MSLTMARTYGVWVNVSYDGGTQDEWVRRSALNLPGIAVDGSGSDSRSTGRSGTNGGNGGAANGSGTAGATVIDRSAADAPDGAQGATATVYSSPSISGSVVATLMAGANVGVLQVQGQWDQVALPDGIVGWIDGSALVSVTERGAGSGTSGARQRRSGAPRDQRPTPETQGGRRQ